jgi:hypothetical protein
VTKRNKISDVLKRFAESPAAFRSAVHVDTDMGPRPFGEIMDPRQAATFAALDGGWMRAAGYNTRDGYSRGWSERPRGSSKTADLAVMATWCLAFARRQVSGLGAAVDKDQARLLRDAIQRIVQLNPWLGKLVEVNKFEIQGRHNSRLEIISSDVAASWGATPHFIICDEITHWKNSGLWDSLFSSAAKRRDCLLLCICNAGFTESWQWTLREAIRNDPLWWFDRWVKVACWMSEALLEEQRRLLPARAVDRLFGNNWQQGEGDALDPADIEAAITLDGPINAREDGFAYLAALDIGIRNDRSAVVVCGVHLPTGGIRVVHVRSWHPGRGEVDLQEVEDHLLALHRTFLLRRVVFDPWQAAHMSQRLRRHGMTMAETTFNGSNLQKMAQATINVFAAHDIAMFRCNELIADLKKLRIEEKPWGFRLTAPKDSTGHADTAIALSMALPFCSKEYLYVQQENQEEKPPLHYEKFGPLARRTVQLERPREGFLPRPYSSRETVPLERRHR